MSLRTTTGGGPTMFFAVMFILVVYVVIAGGIGSLVNPYTLNTWLEYSGNTTAHVEWWHGALLGIAPVTNAFTIPAGIITWIVMLFLT